MKTTFNDNGKQYDDDWMDIPLLHKGVLVRGPWGSRRVIDTAISVNESSQTVQTVYLGLVNVHG